VGDIGIRELRRDLKAVIARARAGEVTTVTVSGTPAAVIAPLARTEGVAADISSLVATGALLPPRRPDHHVSDEAVTVWRNVRLDRLLREIR